MTSFTITATATVLLSLIFTLLVRQSARHFGMIAAPRKDRWHSKPTAMMGGVGIYAAFISGVVLFGGSSAIEARRIIYAGTFLFILGLIDDIFRIKPYIKLAGQLVAASAVVFSGLVLPWTHLPPVDYLLTFIWLVGITNAVNLLDNMDGLAGGITLIACLFLGINFLLNGQTQDAVLPLVLASAVTGFLVFNFNPASIFMGDCGSMFLGFTLAGVSLLSDTQRTRNISAVLVTPVLILLIPIFDTTIVTISRKLAGRPVSQGGRDHTSHRLVALGLSDRKAVLLLWLFALISGLLGLAVRNMGIAINIAVIAGFTLTVVFLGYYLGNVGVYEEGKEPEGAWMRVVTGHPYRRRLVEISLDFTLIILAYYVSYLLRFEGEVPADQIPIMLRTLPVVVCAELTLLLAFGIYRGIWKYSGIEDLMRIFGASFLGSGLAGTAILFWYRFHGPSRSVFFINAGLLLLSIGATRISFRLIASLLGSDRHPASNSNRPVIIYGAGDAGELLVRELLNNPVFPYRPVAFIDDDHEKTGKVIRGFRIFESDNLPQLVEQHQVSEIIVSSLKVPQSRLDQYAYLGVEFKRLRIQLD